MYELIVIFISNIIYKYVSNNLNLFDNQMYFSLDFTAGTKQYKITILSIFSRTMSGVNLVDTGE